MLTQPSQFPPVINGKNGQILVTNPMVKIVDFSLISMDLPICCAHAKTEHKSADHFSLYTKEEMEEFDILLYFDCSKEPVLTELTEKYCSDQSCGSLSFQLVGQMFDINRLRNQIKDTLDLTHQLKTFL